MFLNEVKQHINLLLAQVFHHQPKFLLIVVERVEFGARLTDPLARLCQPKLLR